MRGSGLELGFATSTHPNHSTFSVFCANTYPTITTMLTKNTAMNTYLNVAGKSCPVPKHTEKQQIPRSHGFRDPEVVRVGRTHLPVAYPRSALTSLRYPSPPRLRITGRLTPV